MPRGTIEKDAVTGLISVVVPVYNEREVLQELHRRVSAAMSAIDHQLEMVLVDDGSRDGSTAMIESLADVDSRLTGVILSRNFGHEAAIAAGLREARGDAVIVMDADLQDSPELLPQLVQAWAAGADVVYAVRRDRKEGLLQRAAFSAFYQLTARIVDIDLPRDAGPFCLMSRPVVDAMNQMSERGRYFPGLRAFTGFTQVPVELERAARFAGETKYSLRRRTPGAVNAIFSFSKFPLRLVTLLGFICAGLALLGAIWTVGSAVFGTATAPGWVSVMAVVLIFSGVQMMTLGIVGEYVGKVYDEVRARPSFIIARRCTGAGVDTTVPGL